MNAEEEKFIAYWSARRKNWSWKTHAKKTFLNIVLPLAILIDLVNYFIVGDTTYSFVTFGHLLSLLLNIIVIAVFIILVTGFINWNYNEGKYWKILRKNNENR